MKMIMNLNDFTASDEDSKRARIKYVVQGGSGMGKTWTALAITTALVQRTDPGKKVYVIDTENSARLYRKPRGPFDFKYSDGTAWGPLGQPNYDPRKLMQMLQAIEKTGDFAGVIIDSATAFWKEPGGFTSMIDKVCEAQKARGQKADSFAAWKQVDPLYRSLMTFVRQYPLHLCFCIRAKQDYERTEGSNGKGSLKKVGLAPEFREGFEYEFDIQFSIDQDHTMVPLKHRLGSAIDGKVFRNPGDDVAEIIASWLETPATEANGTKKPVGAVTAAPVPKQPEPEPEESPATVPEPNTLEESGETHAIDPVEEAKAELTAATTPETLKALAPVLNARKKTGVFGGRWNEVMDHYKECMKRLGEAAA